MKDLTKSSGGGAKSLAFTLAEVLITLAIIGVVAALTIPVVMANYNKKAQYTAFMKMYNTLQNSTRLSAAEYGEPNNWEYTDGVNFADLFKAKFYPYLKIAKICESDVASCISTYDIKYLNGTVGFSNSLLMGGNGMTVLMQDGSVISIMPTNHGQHGIYGLAYVVDTNGAKGPNILGRDVFMISYSPNAQGIWVFNDGANPEDCDPNGTLSGGGGPGSGIGCSARLLQEGKMSY